MARRRQRHTPEQVVRKLPEADKLLGQGQDIAAVLKHLEISEQTLYRWRKVYGGRQQGAYPVKVHLFSRSG